MQLFECTVTNVHCYNNLLNKIVFFLDIFLSYASDDDKEIILGLGKYGLCTQLLYDAVSTAEFI
jgi:hypothetical protein